MDVNDIHYVPWLSAWFNEAVASYLISLSFITYLPLTSYE